MQFPELERITLNPMIMGGKPCIRGMRITVGTIVGLVASGASFEEILQIYPYWESADIRAAVAYAAWQTEEPRNAIADRTLGDLLPSLRREQRHHGHRPGRRRRPVGVLKTALSARRSLDRLARATHRYHSRSNAK